MYCLNCQCKIDDKKRFCDNKCQQEYQYKKYIEDWKNNKNTGLRGKYQTSLHIKRYLMKKYNKRCAKCGWGKINQYTGKIPLEIEHIDGNYQNNNEENLILLCPNCHSLTSTYKGANLNYGRKQRAKYNK